MSRLPIRIESERQVGGIAFRAATGDASLAVGTGLTSVATYDTIVVLYEAFVVANLGEGESLMPHAPLMSRLHCGATHRSRRPAQVVVDIHLRGIAVG